MRAILRLALISAALPLAGCMTSGTNMHGDFACRAPNGTCAPMSVIDAKAVAGLGGTVQPVGGISDPAVPREGRVVTASLDGTPPGRTSDRVLRVVFPAHIDASGIYHDEATAHAVIEHGSWTDGLTGGFRRTASVAAADALQTGNRDDLQTSKLASLDEVISARGPRSQKSDRFGNAGEPGAATVTPTSAPASAVLASISTAVRLASMRSTNAVDLREAAAAASAQPVAGFDPNFDTPDVAAVAADDATAAPTQCKGYRPVWWHGHAYRRLRPVPCPAQARAAPVADLPSASTGGPVAAAAGSTRALNLGHLEPQSGTISAADTSTAHAAPASSPASTSSLSSSAPTQPALPGATSSLAPATAPVVGYALTTDPKLAAVRVSRMAGPVMDQQVRLGRAEAKSASQSLDQLFAVGGIVATPAIGAPQ